MSDFPGNSSPRGIALDPAVGAALRAALPQVAERTVAAVIAEVDEYADPLRGEMGRNITHAVELALATFLRLAEQPQEAAEGDRLLPALEAAYKLGRGEARSGRTMNALLSAYRVGARVSWEQWGALAIETGLDPELLVPFAALVFAYIDQLSAASVGGHSDELATSGRVREQYLERLTVALLKRAPVDELHRRAEGAGWTPPRTLTCVISAAAHTRGIRAQLDPATLSVAGDAVDVGRPEDATIHLVPDVGPQRASLRAALESRSWVLGPERPWSEAASSYERAAHALRRIAPGRQLIDTERHLAELVLTADPSAHADLRAQALRPLAELKPDAAERLARTLLSWLLHQGRREDVARDLHVHAQTVRYRMTQIRDLYGDRLHDPQMVRDIVVALAADPLPARE